MNAMVPARLSGFELERLMFHWGRVVETSPAGWARDFAKSIAIQSRRRNWKPSPKQGAMMARMVSDLFTYGDDLALIDAEDVA